MEKKTVKKKTYSIWEVITSFLSIQKDIIREKPSFIFLITLGDIIHGSLYGLVPLILKYLFDEITESVSKGSLTENFNYFLILFLLSQVFLMIWNGVINSSRTLENIINRKVISGKLFKKSRELSLYSYEDPLLLDDIENARQGVEMASFLVITAKNILVFYIPVMISYSYLFVMVNPILLMIFPMIIIPSLIIQKLRINAFSTLSGKLGNIRRQRDEFEKSFLDQKYFKETRMLGLVPRLYKKFSSKTDEVTELENNAEKELFKNESLLRVISVLTFISILIFVIYLLIDGRIDVPAFTAVVTSLEGLYNIIEEIIYRHATSLSNDLGFVINYLNYVNMEEEVSRVDGKLSIDGGITVKDLKFSYPGSTKEVLKGISLRVEKGEKIALVGANGSGKTTLSKLLLGLFPHYEGSIKYSGKELKDYSKESASRISSAVFQDFSKYKLSLRENIAISDITKSIKDEEIKVALSGFGLNKDKVKNGLDTILSTEFDGMDLSKGQWQAVSIVRAGYREHDFIILDEPTSAIDPEKESAIYDSLSDLMNNRTALVVTHRMGLTKIADRIIVLEDGLVKEEGTHTELMKGDTLYKKLYNSQQKWYR